MNRQPTDRLLIGALLDSKKEFAPPVSFSTEVAFNTFLNDGTVPATQAIEDTPLVVPGSVIANKLRAIKLPKLDPVRRLANLVLSDIYRD